MHKYHLGEIKQYFLFLMKESFNFPVYFFWGKGTHVKWNMFIMPQPGYFCKHFALRLHIKKIMKS
jgi:hypothetical protein